MVHVQSNNMPNSLDYRLNMQEVNGSPEVKIRRSKRFSSSRSADHLARSTHLTSNIDKNTSSQFEMDVFSDVRLTVVSGQQAKTKKKRGYKKLLQSLFGGKGEKEKKF